jgi:hypothetical protein
MSMYFSRLAKRHWEKYLPGMVKELKARGVYENELERAGEQASAVLADLQHAGAQYEAAREQVMKDYILLDPETTESPTTD